MYQDDTIHHRFIDRAVVFQRVGELSPVVFLLEIGVDEIFVTLIDVLRAAAGPAIDRIDHDVEDGLPEQTCPLAFGNQHGEVQERPKTEYPQLWGLRYVHEICFVNIHRLHG
jgi:hypothetical protein